jgi:hypothetical protein
MITNKHVFVKSVVYVSVSYTLYNQAPNVDLSELFN